MVLDRVSSRGIRWVLWDTHELGTIGVCHFLTERNALPAKSCAARLVAVVRWDAEK